MNSDRLLAHLLHSVYLSPSWASLERKIWSPFTVLNIPFWLNIYGQISEAVSDLKYYDGGLWEIIFWHTWHLRGVLKVSHLHDVSMLPGCAVPPISISQLRSAGRLKEEDINSACMTHWTCEGYSSSLNRKHRNTEQSGGTSSTRTVQKKMSIHGVFFFPRYEPCNTG